MQEYRSRVLRRKRITPPSRAVRMYYTRLISTPLARNEGPEDKKEANHPDQPWNKFQNDSRGPDHDDLTEGAESRFQNWLRARQS